MKKKMVALVLTALLLGGCAGNLSHSTDLTSTVSGAVIEKVDISGESYQPQNPKQEIAGWNLELLRESFSGENILLSPLSLTASLGMAANGAATGASLLCGLGGSLDIFSGTVERAPRVWSDHGLEWFYRLLHNPSRIGRMMKLPLFLVHVKAEKRKRK